ncbi:ABC transporter substrate-binding protein [Kitasatospora sp. LaBMicrA B282]|uniref:RsiG family protein n=1 Tax=Kitasatospora sp. LaBMicrA B282 TaxID=3420949 RepID=UPI003D134287
MEASKVPADPAVPDVEAPALEVSALEVSVVEVPALEVPDVEVSGFVGLGLEELRTLRREALAQEADLSYLRRLLQGRVDILRAELDRRTLQRRPGPRCPEEAPPPGADTLLHRLPQILADAPSNVRQSARHVTLGPPRGEEYQAQADALMGDVRLADLAAHAAAELLAALDRLTAHEREVSGRRQVLQRTADGCGAEITRRYREGEARVDDLLAGRPLPD